MNADLVVVGLGIICVLAEPQEFVIPWISAKPAMPDLLVIEGIRCPSSARVL